MKYGEHNFVKLTTREDSHILYTAQHKVCFPDTKGMKDRMTQFSNTNSTHHCYCPVVAEMAMSCEFLARWKNSAEELGGKSRNYDWKIEKKGKWRVGTWWTLLGSGMKSGWQSVAGDGSIYAHWFLKRPGFVSSWSLSPRSRKKGKEKTLLCSSLWYPFVPCAIFNLTIEDKAWFTSSQYTTSHRYIYYSRARRINQN